MELLRGRQRPGEASSKGSCSGFSALAGLPGYLEIRQCCKQRCLFQQGLNVPLFFPPSPCIEGPALCSLHSSGQGLLLRKLRSFWEKGIRTQLLPLALRCHQLCCRVIFPEHLFFHRVKTISIDLINLVPPFRKMGRSCLFHSVYLEKLEAASSSFQISLASLNMRMAGNVPIPKVAVWFILLQFVASLYRPVWKIASK